VLPTIEELGTGFVPYSPPSRGFLMGKINETESAASEIPVQGHGIPKIWSE
jgi:aryl-alcohol dehydrogenase-like predicted oxidoreductase